jgi:predicted RNA binding protein YcfA (HicA-like mRNA interferase family)
MPRLPVLKPRKVIAALRKAGFEIDHHTGGHAILYKEGHPNPITVPIHAKDIKLGTLQSIIDQAGLTREQFLKLL